MTRADVGAMAVAGGGTRAFGNQGRPVKNIVICCDGTGNEYGRNNTNVVETYALVEKDREQIAYYDPGVGTGGWDYHEDRRGLRAKGDQVTGEGLQKNVEDAYRRLMQCFEPGDRVYLFGFSRGAFTVRSLAGMLHRCGLLNPGDGNLVEYASRIYNTRDNGDDVAAGFRSTFARGCPVEFIGVWDTVESLVLNAGRKWHDHTLNPEVKFAYHALAIDERRRDFLPCPWDESNVADGQTLEQVWFAGVHSDVGGWYEERGLSNVALHWMLGKAAACGLRIDREGLAFRRPDPHDRMHDSWTGIWKARGRRTRKIPEGARIHRSVLERLGSSKAGYRPKNLPKKHVEVS